MSAGATGSIRVKRGMAEMLKGGVIMDVVTPEQAKIAEDAEAQVLQSLGVDYIDESEVLTPADYANHIDKWDFTVPFVCGATNPGEAMVGINVDEPARSIQFAERGW
ncbi:pyridoxal biosynthesis lyase PdxS [Nocardioides nitrophenolicus]|nr:pyridoxal biosynthesis lyase PdxS [Nocardioides nitrophenolicus]